MKTIHLKGFISDDDYNDGVEFTQGYYGSVAENIARELYNTPTAKDSKLETDDYSVDASVYIPKVFFRLHISENEISLEEAENNLILSSIGELDIY